MKYPTKCCLIETVSTNISKYLRKWELSFPLRDTPLPFQPDISCSPSLPLSLSIPYICYHYFTYTAWNITQKYQNNSLFHGILLETLGMMVNRTKSQPLCQVIHQKWKSCLPGSSQGRRLSFVPIKLWMSWVDWHFVIKESRVEELRRDWQCKN